MADKKISELTSIVGADTAADDFFVVVDTSGSVTKKISRAELNNAIEQDVLAQVDITSANIDGGTIDNTPIGSTTASTGNFTTVDTTGNVTVGGNLTVNGTTTTVNSTTLDVDDINITVASGAASAAAADGAGLTVDGASATFNYASTGDKWTMNKPLDVTGTVTADGLTVQSDVADLAVESTNAAGEAWTLRSTYTNTGGAYGSLQVRDEANNIWLRFNQNNGSDEIDIRTNNTDRLNIANNGDVSLYASDGTTQGFYWDASTQRLGLGTTSPAVNLESYVEATGAIPTDETIGVTTGNSNVLIGAHNGDNSATFSGIALETRTSGASRWLIANEWKSTFLGDLVFRYRDGGSSSAEAMRITSAGVGIGTTSPAEELDISADAPAMQLSSTNASGRNYGLQSTNNGLFAFYDSTAGANRMVINSSGNVGIGTASVDNKLHLEHAGTLYLQIENTSTANKFYLGNSGGNAILESTGAYSMNFKTNGSEAARIDSSRNFMCGKTAVNVATAGVEARSDGLLAATRSASTPMYVNRLSTDGTLLELRKDNTTVASIGTKTSTPYFVRSTGGGIALVADSLCPADSTGSPRDDYYSLGLSTNRFSDLYLSGGVYLGGTGSANYLDDYEEGTFTPSLGSGSGSISMTYTEGRYIKIGGFVHAQIRVQASSISGASGAVYITNLPFTVANSLSSTGLEAIHFAQYDGLTTSLYSLMTVPEDSTTRMVLYKITSSTTTNAGSQLLVSDLTNTSSVRATISYRTTA